MKIAKEPVSLETPIGEDEDSSLGDFIEDKSAKNPSDEVTYLKLKEHTRNILDTLSPREASVLRLRFGIDCDSDHTLEEVGKKFTVTRERIRQIEAKALRIIFSTGISIFSDISSGVGSLPKSCCRLRVTFIILLIVSIM